MTAPLASRKNTEQSKNLFESKKKKGYSGGESLERLPALHVGQLTGPVLAGTFGARYEAIKCGGERGGHIY